MNDASIVIPQGFQKILPRSPAQAQFITDIARFDMVFGIGPAGTGKTFLAIAHSLAEILSHRKKKLILTRPVVEAGESLGFLPGDLEEKLNPYVRPLYDAMDALVPAEVITRLEELRIIEIAPLAYMRGRNLKDCCVILDEAQNATKEQMKMFLTRMGEGTRVIITGDVSQIDLPASRQSGLIHAAKVLSSIPEIKFSYFSSRDVVRSRLVRSIINAYDAYEERMNL
jgi:phosphate starvation-inducible PhoH-like protein